MTGVLSLRGLVFDVWLIEQLMDEHVPGLSLDDLRQRWKRYPQGKGSISRTTLTRHRQLIESFFGLIIDSPDKKHYRIANPEQLQMNNLANDLLASMQNYLFLDEYRDLGAAIQPEEILNGLQYLRPIGEAIRRRQKLHIAYQKFTDTEPYEAILHPYCLKASLGRWYLLAIKEGSKQPIQTFALDRILVLQPMQVRYPVNRTIRPATYFRDCFGIWHDFEKYPVQDITIEVSPKVAHYLRTLPLHHSQREISDCRFQYHISPSPDFLGELLRWGDGIRIVEGKESKEPIMKSNTVKG